MSTNQIHIFELIIKSILKLYIVFLFILNLLWILFQGSLSDIKGRKTILLLSLLVCSVAYITIGITNSIFIILFVRAILGKY